MFCKNCGSVLPDEAKFCATCGTVVGESAPAAPAAPAAPVAPVAVQYAPAPPSPTMINFVSVLKGVWAKPIATVATAAKSNSHEWSLLAIIGILTYALGTAVVGLEMLTQLIKSLIGSVAGGLGSSVVGSLGLGKMYPFFSIFGIGLLIGAAAYFLVSLGIWVLVSQVFKKNASFVNVLNMVAVACLPLAAINLLNMLIGLIYAPLTIIFFITALMLTVICLYNGMQKFDKLEKSPFYGFGIIMLVAALASCLLGLLYFSAVGNAITEYAMGGLGSLMGGLGSSSGLGGLSSFM